MGWSTELFCNITFNRETFNSKYEVESKIEELEACLKIAEEHLKSLILITEPNKFCPEEYDPLSWIMNETKDYLEMIGEYSIDLYKLNLLLDNWDACHNKDGLAINPPDRINWETAFLDGDFVRTIKYPDANSILSFKTNE